MKDRRQKMVRKMAQETLLRGADARPEKEPIHLRSLVKKDQGSAPEKRPAQRASSSKRTITKGEHECTQVLKKAAAAGLSYGKYVALEFEKRQKEGR